MSDIQPTLTPEQFERYSLYYEELSRPFFAMICDIKLRSGRRYTVTPDGEMIDERFLFTPAEQKCLDGCREMMNLCRDMAMREAMGDYLPRPPQ